MYIIIYTEKIFLSLLVIFIDLFIIIIINNFNMCDSWIDGNADQMMNREAGW